MLKYTLNNFRSYNNQVFDFKRVNILIGENSGGKSSLIKSLLALKQTIENPEISNLILSGKYTDLGTYKETIKNHEEDKSIDFTFSFQEELPHYAEFFIFGELDELESSEKKIVKKNIKKALKVETTVKYIINQSLEKHSSLKTHFHNKILGELEISFTPKSKDSDNSQNELLSKIPTCSLIYKSKIRNKTINLKQIEFSKNGFMSFIAPNSLEKACNKHKDVNLYYEIVLFLINQNLIDNALGKIKYLNPLSSNPKRIYINKDTQNKYEKSDLEKFTNLITTNQISTTNIRKFDKILKDYGIADGVKVINSKNLPVSELRVKIKNLVSNISDVGYGVSLQIPMLFEAFIAEQEGGLTFLIEQPEVHLHPKLQAKFIETLLKLGEQNNYIIETHSEHIIRMIQVITKQKLYDITSKEILILYFMRDEDNFNISSHNLDENGRMLEPFPSGFFDTTYNLAKKLMF